MKLTTFVTLGLAAFTQLASAGLIKRADRSEAASVGYATTNGGTTGGRGGSVTTVSTLSALKAAVSGSSPAIVIVSGTISGNEVVKVGSNKSILGKDSNAKLVGVGLNIVSQKNVIIRNLSISKVLASAGDAISLNKASNIWIDHNDLSSDLSHDKDYYDGLLDAIHASEWVSITSNKLHDHFKASLVGHSDSNSAEDKGKLHITYAGNYFSNINSRGPSYRFGTGHIFNNFYENVADGINTRLGAQLLVENNVWSGGKKPLYSTDGGYAVAKGNDFGGAANTAPQGSLNNVPYAYSLIATGSVKGSVTSSAGQKLTF